MIKDSREAPERTLPVEPPAEARTYTVTGSTRVFGHRPGATFDRVVSPAQEARLIASGAITPNESEKPDGKTPDAEVPDGVEKRPEVVRGESADSE